MRREIPRPSGTPVHKGTGFTYVGLLIAVAILGVALAGAGEVWSIVAKREQEAELLFVGNEFRRAIGLYYESSPGTKVYPERLEDLLDDKRLPVVRRHLRKIYSDPMTGSPEWGLLKLGERIVGVHSRSPGTPIKRAGFKPEDAGFEDSAAYSNWKFAYAPAGRPALAGAVSPLTAPPGGVPPAGTTLPGGPPGVQAVPGSPRDPRLASVPRPSWACAATRTTDLRACEQTASALGEEAAQACRQAAAQRYRACVSGAEGEAGTPATQ